MAFSSWRTWTTGEIVTAAHMNQEVRDNGEALFPDEDAGVSWSPTLEATTTDPVVASVSGVQYRIGALQFVWVRFVLDADPAGSGTYFVELPVAASGVGASTVGGSGQAVGSWQSRDNSNVNASEGGTVLLRSSTAVHFALPDGGLVRESSPFAWDVDDVLSFHAVYPAA